MSVLPPDTQNVLTQLLTSLYSSDNAVRSAAEALLETEWTSRDNVESLLVFLAEKSCAAEDESMRAFAAVLFRRVAIKSPKDFKTVTERTIGVVSEPARDQIRAILLNGFTLQQSNQVRHKLSDAISEVAKEDASPAGTWNNLIPALFEATTNQDPSFRESAFRVFALAPELINKHYIQQALPVFNAGFEDSNDDVRIAACTAFVAFFRELPKSAWASLSPLLPNLLNSLPRFLQNGQDASLALVLELLIDLVELAPKMFKDMFPTIIEFCSTVCKDKDLEGTTRMALLELLTTFAEMSPAMCKRTASYTSLVVVITLSMLTEVCLDDDDCAEWNNSVDIDDDEDEMEYLVARQSLDRVALRLGGQSLASPLFQYLPAMVHSSEWRERQAALMALSAAAEGCADVLTGEIPKILDLILPSLQDSNPRVQFACCNALGQMSTDFADVIQRTASDRILPSLILMLTTKSVPRVQAHAAAALVNFSEAASKEVLEPYLDDLLNNLVGLLQLPKRYVQEQVLTTIAIIADAAEKKFIKYYDTLMPMLTDVLKLDDIVAGNENRLLKAKCIECCTLIALAVGKEKFAPHLRDVIQLLGHIQQTSVDEDDPVREYLEQAWGRICRIIGKDFLPYLPEVLPPLLLAARATQDISLLEEEQVEEFNLNEEWDIINVSGKLIAVHTAALDDKVNAMDLLRTYAIQLKGDFQPWVREIIQDIAIPALDFYLHDGVRCLAALTLALLLRCLVYATGPALAETLSFWSQIANKLVEVLINDPVPEILVAYYTALVECIHDLAPNALSSQQLHALADTLNKNMSDIYARIKQRESEEDEYTEDIEEDEEELTDEELLNEINKAVSAIFLNAKANFLSSFQVLAPTLTTFLNDDNTSVKLCGLCIVCDVLEHCGSDLVVYKEMFAVVVGESITSPHAGIRQAALYAVGVAAQHGGDAYADFGLACLEPMFKMASVPDARAEENVHATENSISAIAKVCHRYASQVPNLNAVLEQWILLLPIVQDETAAPFAYTFLAELIKSQHPAVTNNIPKVVDLILQALSYASILGNTAQNVVSTTRQLLGSMPQEEAVALLGKNPAEIDVVRKWFS